MQKNLQTKNEFLKIANYRGNVPEIFFYLKQLKYWKTVSKSSLLMS